MSNELMFAWATQVVLVAAAPLEENAKFWSNTPSSKLAARFDEHQVVSV
jgi:hypothetical protein